VDSVELAKTKLKQTKKIKEYVFREFTSPKPKLKFKAGKSITAKMKIKDERKKLQQDKPPVADYVKLIQKYFPFTEWKTAGAIVRCESNGIPNVVSRTNDWGLFQINAVHRGRVGGDLNKLLDPETNVRVASILWREQGWGIWTCAKKLNIY
jgi:hypothetical protein